MNSRHVVPGWHEVRIQGQHLVQLRERLIEETDLNIGRGEKKMGLRQIRVQRQSPLKVRNAGLHRSIQERSDSRSGHVCLSEIWIEQEARFGSCESARR